MGRKILKTIIYNDNGKQKNKRILNRLLNRDLSLFREFDRSQINDNMIREITNSNIELTTKDFINYPQLLFYEKNIYYAIDINPRNVLLLNKINDKYIDYAIEKGFIPTKQDIKNRIEFRHNEKLLLLAFEKDPSVISLFDSDMIDNISVLSAYNRGYIATKDDLELNKKLCNYELIMLPAIKNDPSLIKFIRDECILSMKDIEDALNKYTLTEEDIINNPCLVNNYYIISHYPEFNKYNMFLVKEDKIDMIVDCLKNNKPIDINTLPFLDKKFGGNIDVNKISKLLDSLKLKIDEEDIKEQTEYKNILNTIINNTVEKRYLENKNSFRFSSIVSLNDQLTKIFSLASENDNTFIIDNFAEELYEYIKEEIPLKNIKEKLYNFYDLYLQNGYSLLEDTSTFCNTILNKYRQFYLSKERKEINDEVRFVLDTSGKKKEFDINRIKIDKIREIISNREFKKLGITELDLIDIVSKTVAEIMKDRFVKRTNISIDRVKLLSVVFMNNGIITKEDVNEILDINNKEIEDFVRKKFERIKSRFLNNIEVDDKEINLFSNDLSRNDYIYGDQNKYYNSLATIILSLNDDNYNKIMNNKSNFNELLKILPFMNIVDELNKDSIINVMCNYNKIRDNIINNYKKYNKDSKIDIDDIIKEIMFNIGNYKPVDKIYLDALGPTVVSKIGELSSILYLDFYKKMLNRKEGEIPPIELDYGEYHLESGIYSDPERLLVGKIPTKDSCIDLDNSAGYRTFTECLLYMTGDVILVRNKNGELITRIFAFRRGNVIQLVAKAREIFSIDLYKKIADKMMREIIKKNDNVDYILLNSVSLCSDDITYDKVSNVDFVKKFPHADFNKNACILSCKNPVTPEQFDFEVEPKAKYIKNRKKISTVPLDYEIKRLKALDIILEKDNEDKENKKNNYNSFNIKDYKRVIYGEDWYIAIRNDNSIEKLILPIADEKTYNEVDNILSSLNNKKTLKLKNIQ